MLIINKIRSLFSSKHILCKNHSQYSAEFKLSRLEFGCEGCAYKSLLDARAELTEAQRSISDNQLAIKQLEVMRKEDREKRDELRGEINTLRHIVESFNTNTDIFVHIHEDLEQPGFKKVGVTIGGEQVYQYECIDVITI